MMIELERKQRIEGHIFDGDFIKIMYSSDGHEEEEEEDSFQKYARLCTICSTYIMLIKLFTILDHWILRL